MSINEDDNSLRYVTLSVDDAQAAVGTWQIIVHADNEILAWGNLGEPTIEAFTACQGTTCLEAASETATAMQLDPGQTLDLTWATSHLTTGLTTMIYTENQDGQRDLISEQYTVDGSSHAGTGSWSTFQSGTYTVTLEVFTEVGHHSIAQKVAVVVIDSINPAAPSNFQALGLADSSVELSWTAPNELDIAGYQFTIDGVTEISVEEQLTSYHLYGLDLTVPHTVTIAAYDINDNLGPTSSTIVTFDTFNVVSSWPARGVSSDYVDHVRIAFDQPIILDSFTVEDNEGTLLGTTELLTETVGVTDTQTIGALWLPTDGQLAAHTYTATVQVRSVDTNESQIVTWPFEVRVRPTDIYLPIVRR